MACHTLATHKYYLQEMNNCRHKYSFWQYLYECEYWPWPQKIFANICRRLYSPSGPIYAPYIKCTSNISPLVNLEYLRLSESIKAQIHVWFLPVLSIHEYSYSFWAWILTNICIQKRVWMRILDCVLTRVLQGPRRVRPEARAHGPLGKCRVLQVYVGL